MRPYQVDAIEAVERALADGTSRPVLALATGLGKTVVFSELLRRRGGPALVLAHRDELVRQAAEKIRNVWPDADLGIVKAEEDEFDKPVVVASVQSLTAKRLARWSPDRFETVVVDEAHHASAPSYLRILDYLSPELRLGVTATPFRGDKTTLEGVFDRVVYSFGIKDGIREGFLSDIRAFRVKSETSLDDVATRAGDFAQGALEKTLDTDDRNRAIVRAYREKSPGKRALVFSAGVDHAHALAAEFARAGFSSGAVDGTMDLLERQKILGQLKSGEILVVTNYGVLTEGFDCPAIETVILARPTKSLVLFTQMVGRGSRPSPDTGKTHMTLIDVVDQTRRHRLVTIADLVGQPVKVGKSVAETIEEADGREKAENDKIAGFVRTLRPDMGYEEIDLLCSEIDRLTMRPDFDWRDVRSEIEDLSEEDWTLWLSRSGWHFSSGKGASESQVRALSGFGWPEKEAKILSVGEASWAIDRQMTLLSSWTKGRESVFNRLVGTDLECLAGKPWEFHPATEKQIGFLVSLGYPGSLIGKGLTKREAALLIESATGNKKPVAVEARV
jgi:superfamily II DNA or RNA helicase